MSRSYKHSPCIVVGCKKEKKTANKTVRRYKGDLNNGCAYKRLYNSYNIRDYVFYNFSEIEKNKKFREVAKIVRRIYQGKLKAESYNLDEFLEILNDTDYSFEYLRK